MMAQAEGSVRYSSSMNLNRYTKYLEVIDYQLFAVNTVEKWIGSYLWVYGK